MDDAAPTAADGIYQRWLDKVSQRLWDHDFNGVAAAMAYPHWMASSDARMLFDVPAKLAQAARDFRAQLCQIGAQAYHRICEAAHFVGEGQDRIEGRHTTYVIRGGQFALDPFSNQMTLIRQGSVWLGAGISAAVRLADCPIISPRQLQERYRHD